MPAEWWFEARTEEEAIERGVEELGLSRDEVEVVDVVEGERGLLGLIGKKVRVLLRVKQDWRNPWTRPAEPATEPEEDEEPGDQAFLDDEEDGRPVSESPGRDREEQPRERAVRAPAGAPTPEILEAEGRAIDFLTRLLERMEMQGEVDGHSDSEGVHLEVRGENGGILIGRRGSTLDAIQYTVNRVVSRGKAEAVRVFVDAEGYRARRNQQIEDMALRLADRAKKTGKPVTLKNLSARERRIVHQVLQKDRGLSTKSVGEGEERKLLIIPRRTGGKHHAA